MIINYFHVPGVFTVPAKADPELVIDSDAPLALAVALQLLQPVTRRLFQIFDGARKVERLQSSGRGPRNAVPSPALSGQKGSPGFVVCE